jgi:hypothetical protein
VQSQVHGFIKQSKGHVKIYSEEGNGTTVKIYLPRECPKCYPKKSGELRRAPSKFPLKNTSCWSLRDDPGVRTFTFNALRELGYEAIDADAAGTAHQKLLDEPRVTILLTDVVLPTGQRSRAG